MRWLSIDITTEPQPQTRIYFRAFLTLGYLGLAAFHLYDWTVRHKPLDLVAVCVWLALALVWTTRLVRSVHPETH